MATITDLKLDAIGASIRDGVTSFCEKTLPALGDNLRSITVVGSSVTEDFKPGLSDINTVLVLGKQDIASLNALASLVRSMGRKKISPPLLMTESYIERSRDVFGVEFLDFQLSHRTILGDDPFAALTFDKKDVRLQCERELKAMLIRLRQGYIASAASKTLVRDILISAAKGLEPLLDGLAVVLHGAVPVAGAGRLLSASEGASGGTAASEDRQNQERRSGSCMGHCPDNRIVCWPRPST